MMGFKSPNYTQVPNDLFGNCGKKPAPGLMAEMGYAELKVVLAVCRITFGFHRESARASLTTIATMTGLSRQGVLDGAAKAEEHGHIQRYQDGGVTLWAVAVEDEGDQADDEVVEELDQNSQATLPPSSKERRKKTTMDEPDGSSCDNKAGVQNPPDPLSPDNEHSRLLFSLLAREFKAKGRASPKRFPSLECKTTFDTAAAVLSGELETAIRKALKQSITSIPRITCYVEAWANNKQRSPSRGDRVITQGGKQVVRLANA